MSESFKAFHQMSRGLGRIQSVEMFRAEILTGDAMAEHVRREGLRVVSETA